MRAPKVRRSSLSPVSSPQFDLGKLMELHGTDGTEEGTGKKVVGGGDFVEPKPLESV